MSVMTPEIRRNLVRYAIAADLIVIAWGVALLNPASATVALIAFIGGVTAAALLAGDEAALAATALSVIVLSFWFSHHVDPTTLTLFAATGAVIATLERVLRTTMRATVPAAHSVAPSAADRPGENPFLLATALPLLAVVLYTDVSDVLMTALPVPSLLQPLIVILALVAWRFRHQLQPWRTALQPVSIALTAYALVIFSSSIWAKDAGRADAAFSEIVKAVIVLILTATLATSWRVLRRGLAALVVSATILASLSLVQVTTGHFAHAFAGLVELKAGTIYGDVALPRAAGPPVSDPNFYARILLMTIPLAIGLALSAKVPLRRLGYFAAAVLITGGTLATYSRGAMLSLFVMGVLLLLSLRLRPSHIAAAALVAAAVFVALPDTITRRFITIEALLPRGDYLRTYDSAVEERKVLVMSGLAMFAEYPLTGVGAGHYGRFYPEFANQIGSSAVDYDPPGTEEFPHGLFVEIASETGLLGLLTFGTAMIAAFASLLRSRRVLYRRGDEDRAIIATSIAVALATYFVASIFLHETHLRYLGLYFGFVVAVVLLTRQSERAEAEP